MDVCPDGCGRPLSLARTHCTSEQRATPCGWLRCACGAVVHPDGRFTPAPVPPTKEKR